MLARLAATIRARQGLGAATPSPNVGGVVGEGGTIVFDENCHVSLLLLFYILSKMGLAYKFR